MDIDETLNAQAAGRASLMQFEVPETDAKKMLSLYLIAQDLEEMVKCINLSEALGLPNTNNTLMITALWEKVLIMYGKLFATSKDGYSSLNENMMNPVDLPLHRDIIALRNSYLAHRGKNILEHHKLILSVEGTEDNCHVEFIVPTIQLKGHYGNHAQIRRHLKRLRKEVLLRLAHKRDKYEREVWETLGLEPNPA